jgi:hypothetical protein
MSNQEAVWLKDDPEVEALLRQSDFYMIAARPEAKFLDFSFDERTRQIHFTFAIGDSFRDSVALDLSELPGIAADSGEDMLVEMGDKIVRAWDRPKEKPGAKVLEWFTTEALIWDRARERPGVQGFDHYRDAAVYDLLYVGIAKVGDSFDRLISRGHKTRMEILANESQRFPGSRVTDETYLFLFAVDPLTITTFDVDHDFSEKDFAGSIDHKLIVADAEKAFVSLLQPSYNVVKFTNYPKSVDGLYGSGFSRYAYYIGEDLTFQTPHGRFRGRRFTSIEALNQADFVHVEGDTVKLMLSGVDFPNEESPPAET